MTRSLGDIFDVNSIKLNIKAETKKQAFAELVDTIMISHPECDRDKLLIAILDQEDKMNTRFANAVAIPHAEYSGISNMTGAIGVSKQGIDYMSLDDKPIHILFLLVISKQARENHLFILNQLVKLAQSKEIELMKNAKNPEEIHAILTRVHLYQKGE